MSNKISNLLDTATPVALQAGGFMLGLVGHRGINRLVETDTVQGLLGNETATSFKRFVTPFAVTAIGILVGNYVDQNSPLKELANGFAVSGAVNFGMELFFNTNLMCDKGNGVIGSLLGGDDDLDYFEGYEEAEESEPEPIQKALPVAGPGLTLPSGKAAMPELKPSMVAGVIK